MIGLHSCFDLKPCFFPIISLVPPTLPPPHPNPHLWPVTIFFPFSLTNDNYKATSQLEPLKESNRHLLENFFIAMMTITKAVEKEQKKAVVCPITCCPSPGNCYCGFKISFKFLLMEPCSFKFHLMEPCSFKFFKELRSENYIIWVEKLKKKITGLSKTRLQHGR